MAEPEAGWTAPDRERRAAWRRLTFQQRLDWLWQAKVFAGRAVQAAQERRANRSLPGKPMLESVVRKIKSSVSSAGRLRIWGVDLSRPGEIVYQVADASLTDDRVLRILLRLDTTSPILEIEDPSGVEVEVGNLTIASASAVRWDGEVQPRQPGAKEALFLGD